MSENLPDPSRRSFITRATKNFLVMLRQVNTLIREEVCDDRSPESPATEEDVSSEVQSNKHIEDRNSHQAPLAISIQELQRLPLPQLSYLLTFESPRQLDLPPPVSPLFPYASWEAFLGDSPATVANRLQTLGALVRSDLRHHLAHKFSKNEMQTLLKARQLPSSGNKAELVERLVKSDEAGLWAEVEELQLFVYTDWAWYAAKTRLESLLNSVEKVAELDPTPESKAKNSAMRSALQWLLATAAAGVVGNRVDGAIVALIDNLRSQPPTPDETIPEPEETPQPESPLLQPESPLSTPTQRSPARRSQSRIGFEWVKISAGHFLMGSDKAKDKDARDRELPQHKLYLPDFWIAKTPVTNAQYKRFVDATQGEVPSHWKNGNIPQGKETHPVTYVSWHDALKFCEWAGVRLPTEAEWERAARGTSGRIYPWGNEAPDQSRCNFHRNVGDTTPVGNYPKGATPEGVLDMAGNVWEWNSTKFKAYPYDAGDGREELKGDDNRLLRGGSFSDFPNSVRGASRYRNLAEYRGSNVGFRVVVSVSPGS